MKPVVLVSGPRDAGAGERHAMVSRAEKVFAEAGIAAPIRIDVPGKGTGGEPDGDLRAGVEGIVPALQSGSLFGDRTGVLVMDAHQLLKHEASVIAELLEHVGEDTVIVFVAAGAVRAPLSAMLKERAETITVNRINARAAGEWLADAARRRKLKVQSDAAAVLLQRFGTDLAALGQALDQLVASGNHTVTAEAVQARFRNRPDEPSWHYADAVADGDVPVALRRLADFLVHGHPLQLLGFMEAEVRRLALAGAAPDIGTYAGWVGSSPEAYPVKKAWRRRSEVRDSDVAKAIDALARADLVLKTEPEATHRVTLERLTVALCRWLG